MICKTTCYMEKRLGTPTSNMAIDFMSTEIKIKRQQQLWIEMTKWDIKWTHLNIYIFREKMAAEHVLTWLRSSRFHRESHCSILVRNSFWLGQLLYFYRPGQCSFFVFVFSGLYVYQSPQKLLPGPCILLCGLMQNFLLFMFPALMIWYSPASI